MNPVSARVIGVVKFEYSLTKQDKIIKDLPK